jgi:hypothetical protein
VDIERLRSQVASGEKPLRITTHAQVEAAKDGLLLADLRFVFEEGRVIEEYPEERRMLLYADTPADGIPAHIVVESAEAEGVIVTAYVPDPDIWIANVRRRRKR